MANNALTFKRLRRDPSSGSTPLLFNDAFGTYGGGSDLQGVVQIGGLRAYSGGISSLDGTILLSATGSPAWDIAVPDGPGNATRFAFGHGQAIEGASIFPWGVSTSVQQEGALTLIPARSASSDCAFPFAYPDQVSHAFEPVLFTIGQAFAGFESPFIAAMDQRSAHLETVPSPLRQIFSDWTFPFLLPPQKANDCMFPFANAIPRVSSELALRLLDGRTICDYCVFPFGFGHRLYPGVTPRPPAPPINPPYQGQNHLVFRWQWLAKNANKLIFNRQFYRFVPILRTYLVLNIFDFYRLSDGQRIPANSVTISTDASSWCWSFSGSLASIGAADLLMPAGGQPVEVRCMINGENWDFAIDDPQGQEANPDSSGSAHGRSLSAYLDEPYAKIDAWSNADARTAEQLANDAITLAQLPLASILFNVDDWLIPAGVWSFKGSPQKAVARIAESIGAILQSEKTGIGLILSERYPDMPWEWGNVTPYATIPRNYWVSRGRRWLNLPPYDVVSIAGEVVSLLANVRIYGTAGNRPAPSIVERLAVNATSARQRGESILGNTGLQSLETITMPVGSTLGLVPLGALLEFQDVTTWRGIVRSVSISASSQGGALEVYQTLEIERHH